MSKIKVRGGTAKHGEDLCQTCKYASRREDESGMIVTECNMFNAPIRRKVVDCNQYQHRNHTHLFEMKEIAWILTPGRVKIGFQKYSEMDEKEKEKISLPSEHDY